MDQKYERKRVLGKGSFGKAYLVMNTEANELCVVKQMETSMMDKKEREEAVKEAMLLKKMNHKNIVRFQEVFMTKKGRLCIVMDYADGGDVHMEIKRRGTDLIEESRILEWFVQTCFALKHVHDGKVLHRDLKTQNIFLMASGQIKLGDFGIARVLDATKDYAKTMVGTPYYLSPEIIEDRPYNFKSDVWSLGVVLYEMTTLKHPFDADVLVILASKILKDEYPAPDASYSPELLALIKEMLSKDSKVRPLVREIMSRPFLYSYMNDANAKYALDLDLSEFEPTAPAAPEVEPQASAEFGETGASRKGHDSDYDDDFEDYSEPEDTDAPKTELSKSVANLKLTLGAARGSPALDPVAEAPAASSSGFQPPAVGATASKYGAKAEALQSYLKTQVTEEEFDRAYALVRSTSEVPADELKERVGEIIGAEKAPELVTLFQLLCFLQDMSANQQGQGSA